MSETDPYTTDHGLQRELQPWVIWWKMITFLSFSDFTERYDIETNFLTFQGVISAVKSLWKSNEANLHNEYIRVFYWYFFKDEKTKQTSVQNSCEQKTKETHYCPKEMGHGLHAWNPRKYRLEDNLPNTFSMHKKITKLIVFQFKLLHSAQQFFNQNKSKG